MMSIYYRVDMRPLEPYTLGTEQGSRFEGGTSTGKESYIIASGTIPEQTTILGALRYIVLKEKKLLRHDFRYDDEERGKVEAAIGKNSFSFLAEELQEFGVIKKLSPLFLTERCDTGMESLETEEASKVEIYIKNPFHNKSSDGYDPMELTQEAFGTSYGKIFLPCIKMDGDEPKPEYDAKKGHGKGYIRLSDKKVISEDELFSKRLLTGNRTGQNEKGDSEGFFKREAVALKEGFEFSVYLEAEEGCFPKETIAFMGRKKSAFRFRFTQVDKKECDLCAKVEEFFKETPGCWQYALSDLYPAEPLNYNDFVIVEEKSLRNIETRISEDKYVNKRGKSPHQFHLIESGSVFYGREKELQLKEKLKNKNAENIGYNVVACLGGK